MPFISLTDIELQENLIPGFNVRFVHSENMTFAFWDIKAGSLLPEHAHPHEQVARPGTTCDARDRGGNPRQHNAFRSGDHGLQSC